MLALMTESTGMIGMTGVLLAFRVRQYCPCWRPVPYSQAAATFQHLQKRSDQGPDGFGLRIQRGNDGEFCKIGYGQQPLFPSKQTLAPKATEDFVRMDQ